MIIAAFSYPFNDEQTDNSHVVLVFAGCMLSGIIGGNIFCWIFYLIYRIFLQHRLPLRINRRSQRFNVEPQPRDSIQIMRMRMRMSREDRNRLSSFRRIVGTLLDVEIINGQVHPQNNFQQQLINQRRSSFQNQREDSNIIVENENSTETMPVRLEY